MFVILCKDEEFGWDETDTNVELVDQIFNSKKECEVFIKKELKEQKKGWLSDHCYDDFPDTDVEVVDENTIVLHYFVQGNDEQGTKTYKIVEL